METEYINPLNHIAVCAVWFYYNCNPEIDLEV